MAKLIDVYQDKFHKVYNILGLKIKIKNDESQIFKFKKHEPEIKKYKYVHLMNTGFTPLTLLNLSTNILTIMSIVSYFAV